MKGLNFEGVGEVPNNSKVDNTGRKRASGFDGCYNLSSILVDPTPNSTTSDVDRTATPRGVVSVKVARKNKITLDANDVRKIFRN